jgi:predicted DNA-binding protein (MmcQ/YjbR family)
MHKIKRNDLLLAGLIPQSEIKPMIDKTFHLMVSKITKKDQQSILVHLE